MDTRSFIYRLLTLAGLLSAVAWWTAQGGWEPAITSIGLLAAFLYQDVPREKSTLHDQQLFQQFLKDFPSSGRSAEFLKNHDVGGSFRKEELHEIEKFAYSWKTVEHELDNKYVNTYLTDLKKKCGDFLDLLAVNVMLSSSGVIRFIPDDWDMKPGRVKMKNKLNELASEAYKAHQAFILQARKHL